MDIEGADLKALEGAKTTIKRDKPDLAICVYHKINDLWEIPNYIKYLVPEYSFAIRHCSITKNGTIMYAKII